ncbi:MAG TPA: molybdopterin-binding protein [Blastocatellia bacterium]|nr:molybdopterin-binding protein [Blastocatellia bacterium]
MTSVEIIVVGNEVLLGVVQDTNSSYLCRVMRAAGTRVRHIAVVADEIPEIVSAVKSALSRGAGIIFTCGGLGPTVDDLTLAAVSEAAGRPLLLNDQAREFVAGRYRALAKAGLVDSPEMSDSRLKMANLPDGALVVENPVGTAPAAIVMVSRSRIVSLPGVPAELKAIIEGPLQPLLAEWLGPAGYYEQELEVECRDESVLAPILRQAAERHPTAYIKSRAAVFGQGITFRVLIASGGKSREAAQATAGAVSEDLRMAFSAAGIRVRD